MPTYDYECQACQHQFERYQKMSAKKLRKCPECGKPKLIRLVGMGAGVIFKGSGFYETDYKRLGAGKETKALPAAAGDTKSSSEGTGSSSPSGNGAKSDTKGSSSPSSGGSKISGASKSS